MYQAIKVLIRVLFLGLLFMMAIFLSIKPVQAMDMESGHDMSSHHQHMMLNHAHRLAEAKLQVMALLNEMPGVKK